MNNAKTSNLTPQECMDESILLELKKKIQKARNADKKAEKAMCEVYHVLEDMGIDLETHSNAENATTLEEAINCYIQYGEYGLKNLMREIREVYCKK